MQSTKGDNNIASVLLVDDEEDFLSLLSERLEVRGMRTTTASDGYVALRRIAEQVFDIIVIDLSMPGMDGIETMKAIKSRQPDTEMIMLTGHATLQSGIEAMKTGAEDFLEKPADIDLLIQKIHEAQYRRIKKLEKACSNKVNKILKTKGW